MAASAVHAQDLASAHQFVAGLYAHYPTAGRAHPFDPLGKAQSLVFDAPLIRLMQEDRRLSKGEVGALDGDPLCDCQDDSGMRFQVGEARAGGPDKASATVVRRGPDKEKPETITLDLVHTAAGWRIHDIHSGDTPSLRELLITSNREAEEEAK